MEGKKQKTKRITFRDIIFSEGAWRLKFLKLFDYWMGSLVAFFAPSRLTVLTPLISPKRMLVIRPGGIGDAIFLLPFLRKIRESFPIDVDILCEKRNRDVFSSQKDLRLNIFCYDRWGQFREIFQRKYDVIIDTEQWHYLSALTAYFLKPSFSVGFATRPLRGKLFHYRIPYSLETYELENFQRLFNFLLPEGDETESLEETFYLAQEDLAWAQRQLPQGERICLGLGASVPARKLTQEQSKAIIQYLLEKGKKVILLGGKDSKGEATDVRKKLTTDCIVDFTGKTTLVQTAALIATSQLFIGPDSGLLHLACAVGVPVIGIFGPGNRNKWAPREEKHTVIRTDMPCSPCTHFGYTVVTCKREYPCMRINDIAKLYSVIDKTERIAST